MLMEKIMKIIFKDQTIKCKFKTFEIINQATGYDVRCSVKGGGHTGQAEPWYMAFQSIITIWFES